MCRRYTPTAPSYHTSSIAATNRASVTQNKQHNKQTMTTTVKTLMRLKLQRAAAAAAVVVARAPPPQANERQMAKEKTATYIFVGSKGINKNTCCSSLQHGVVRGFWKISKKRYTIFCRRWTQRKLARGARGKGFLFYWRRQK